MGALHAGRCDRVAMDDESDDVGPWDREFELWEHQGGRLTVGQLRLALTNVDDDPPVIVVVHDGDGAVELIPRELGPVGHGDRPRAIALTVSNSR